METEQVKIFLKKDFAFRQGVTLTIALASVLEKLLNPILMYRDGKKKIVT